MGEPITIFDLFHRNLRFLLVEADVKFRNKVKEILQSCSYEVTDVGLASAAITLLKRKRDLFDCVIADIAMPDMDAITFLKVALSIVDIPVVLKSKSTDNEVSIAKRAIRNGACHFLTSSENPKDFMDLWQYVYKRKKEPQGFQSENSGDSEKEIITPKKKKKPAPSTTGALEAAYKQAFGKGISLSEQQLVDCAGAFNNFGCNGGLPSQAFEYIKYNGGLETEEAYPYKGEDGVCKYTSENAVVKVVESVNITLGAEDELKHAVALVRPVSVAFQVVPGFKLYNGGVYTSNTCGKNPMDVNHAVLAVGYGVENGIPYWLVKNSWGGDWGDNGYFKIEMGKNMCGIATCASYPVVA